MKRGDKIFCEFRNGQERDYAIRTVASVYDGIAKTDDGLVIDAVTGMENSEEFGVRAWTVLDDSTRPRYRRMEDLITAKKWIFTVSKIPDRMLQVYHQCHKKPVDKRRFFHEIDDQEYRGLFLNKMQYIANSFKRPEWCGNPHALDGWFGCPRLMKHHPVSENICQSCGCYINPFYGEHFKQLRLIVGASVTQVKKSTMIKDYADIEEGVRRPTAREIDRLMHFFSMNNWMFVDVLKLLYVPSVKRDKDLEKRYKKHFNF